MDAEWLRLQFKLYPEKSKADLAAALGLDRPAISKILAGTRQIKATEYAGMRRFFDLPVDGERATTRGNRYVLEPLVTDGMADHGGADGDSGQWVMPASLFANRTRGPAAQIRVFTVSDKAMIPDLMPGENVLVDMADTTPSPPGFFLLSDGVGHIIRQCAIIPGSRPALLRLTALNGAYEAYELPMSAHPLSGRVIAKLQWL